MTKTIDARTNAEGAYSSDLTAPACVAKEAASDGTSRMATVPEMMMRGFRDGRPERATMFADPAGIHYQKGWVYFNEMSGELRHAYSKEAAGGLPWHRRAYVQQEIPAKTELPVIAMVICDPRSGDPQNLAILEVGHPDMEGWVAKIDTPGDAEEVRRAEPGPAAAPIPARRDG